MIRRGETRRYGFATPALRLVVLVSYSMLTFGMPLPARKGPGDGDPYPCQKANR